MPEAHADVLEGALPHVSVVLLCYQSRLYVRDALRSAFEQDYAGPLEIIVSDDASSDGTYDVVVEEAARYAGPRAVRLNRLSVNTGTKGAHLNEVLPMASGEIIVSFDADDVADRARVRRIVDAFRENANVFAVYSSYSRMDRDGRPLPPGDVPHPPPGARADIWFARVDAYAAGATLAIKNDVARRFGRLPSDINEDVVLPFRASLLGNVVFIDAPLVRLRRHAESLTANWVQFTSIEQFRARMLVGIERARQTVRSRLEDIDSAIAMMPERSDALAALRRAVFDSVRAAEMTAPLTSPSVFLRLAALLRLVRAGAYKEVWMQHAALAIAPNLYLAHKRSMLGMRTRSDRQGTASGGTEV